MRSIQLLVDKDKQTNSVSFCE